MKIKNIRGNITDNDDAIEVLPHIVLNQIPCSFLHKIRNRLIIYSGHKLRDGLLYLCFLKFRLLSEFILCFADMRFQECVPLIEDGLALDREGKLLDIPIIHLHAETVGWYQQCLHHLPPVIVPIVFSVDKPKQALAGTVFGPV